MTEARRLRPDREKRRRPNPDLAPGDGTREPLAPIERKQVRWKGARPALLAPPVLIDRFVPINQSGPLSAFLLRDDGAPPRGLRLKLCR